MKKRVKIIKRCPCCNHTKLRCDFYVNKTRKDGLSGYCKTCMSIKMKSNYRENYKPKRKISDKNYFDRNKERVYKNNKRFRDNFRLLVDSLKTPCEKCGESRPYCIAFHHIDYKEKSFTIGKGVVSKDRLLTEIGKCVCLCENCHREYHYLYGNNPTNPKESLECYLGKEL